MNWAQRAALSLDLVVLIWFYYRQRLASGRYSKVRTIWPKVWLSLLWAPAIIGALDLLWLNIPSPEATTVREQYWPEDKRHGLAAVGYALSQPVDHVLCPGLNWGCRFLTVDHRTLVDHVWKGEAIADLRAGSGNTKAAIAAIEGAFFRNRVLRFAKLDESRLYGADLIDADLRHATLQNTNLQEARLAGVQLQGADLRGAQLQGADLHYAHLQGVRLVVAKLQGADLGGAQLQGADLDYAHLQAANLNAAELQGATLNWANLESASLG
ncbi:MAG TPA: pentapeptide repeat-containing protein, partial [Acetobacteraceae bacterium]|nr:pentapeptide repeat-containing protein [Acetobacteraceae bacterium]